MNLKPRGKGGSGTAITEKAFVDRATVLTATDVSLQDPYPRDLAIEFELEVGGLDFPIKLTIGGDLKKGLNGEITGWGGAFVIDMLAEELGLYEDEEVTQTYMQDFENNKIPPVMLTRLQGKPIYKVSYASELKADGKIKYRSFNIISLSEEIVTKAWKDSVAKGFPSNYSPDIEPEDVDNTTDDGYDEELPI